jgi:antitoxin (DNA-binding transcriptional repressor) of toxin-antitoxin stability system
VLARNGKAVARLVPVGRASRSPGGMKGRIRISRDFDAPLPDAMAKAFRGEAE